MRLWLGLCVVVGVGLSGCRAKSYPAFYEAERSYQVLVAREGDDAYPAPEMDQVLAALKATPPGSREGPKAQALVATIEQERARVERERAEAARPPVAEVSPEVVFPPSPPSPPAPPEPAPAAEKAPDEPATPQPGMPERDFQRRFGSCVTGPEVITLPEGKAPAYTSLDDERCRKLLGVTVATKFFFIDAKLAGRAVQVPNPQAAAAAEQARKAAAEAKAAAGKSEDFLFVPGGPLPKALADKVPPPNTGAMPAAATGQGLTPTTATGTLPQRTR
ncbi:MAG: hypothetical protein INH41_21850 [Myxococcaceae bacterium]|nr:hypothetical protein [Myxococcaceae bacterium]MCA3015040.1 hypothetical protein [Myxococcaceae bacterium]